MKGNSVARSGTVSVSRRSETPSDQPNAACRGQIVSSSFTVVWISTPGVAGTQKMRMQGTPLTGTELKARPVGESKRLLIYCIWPVAPTHIPADL
jgi:hypothetical protein